MSDEIAGFGDAAAVAFVESVTVVADALAQAKHFHKPDLTSPRQEERFSSGAREVRYPCGVCGEMLPWRHG